MIVVEGDNKDITRASVLGFSGGERSFSVMMVFSVIFSAPVSVSLSVYEVYVFGLEGKAE